MQEKQTFKHESIEDAKSIQRYIEALSQALKSGKLSFSDGDQKIEMSPSDLMHLKLSASKEGGNNRFSLRVTWQDEKAPVQKSKRLTID